MNWHTLTASYLIAALLVVDPSGVRAPPPGGYRNFVEARGPEPQTGEMDRWVGTFLSSLGAIRTALGAGTYVLGLPRNCSKLGLNKDQASQSNLCAGTRNYGIAGMALGGTMLIGGLVYLIVSWRKDRRHREWKYYSRRSMQIRF